MWYVIQIETGRESELQNAIQKIVDRKCYENCFYIKRERVWRRSGKCIVHVEPLFAGYLFISTVMPSHVFKELKKMPQFTKLLRNEENFYQPVEMEEQKFLENLIAGDKDYVVRLSEVEIDENEQMTVVNGPLVKYTDSIVKRRLRLRYVVIRVLLLGEERDVLVGIKLNG